MQPRLAGTDANQCLFYRRIIIRWWSRTLAWPDDYGFRTPTEQQSMYKKPHCWPRVLISIILTVADDRILKDSEAKTSNSV